MFERVYTVNDYYDGPRSGVADYRGHPHHYQSDWDEQADDYADTFSLVPADPETLELVLEQWALWRRWEIAFHSGEVTQESHPGQSGQSPRYAEIKVLPKGRFAAEFHAVRARGNFRAAENQPSLPAGVWRELEVEWTGVG
ncbi:MAG TPA: hypothetical protein VGN07_22425 [Steroidobacteraceae bacterium]|jgi:hypothetical protein